MSKRLFISHSTKDDTHVDRIVDLLKAAGFEDVWVDHRGGLVPGTPSWDDGIREAIVSGDAGIFLMSENSLASGICWSECKLVLELGKPLYVMQLEVCKPESVWLIIKRIHYADLVRDFDNGVGDLISALKGETDTTLPTAVRAVFTGLDTLRLQLRYLNNSLHGRDNDIEEIRKKLNSFPDAVLQIVGIGGVGKSRLVAEIALACPAGAIWYECSDNSQPSQLIALLREHVKLPTDASLTNILARLSEMRPMVVIDDADEVLVNNDLHKEYSDLLQKIAGCNVPVLIVTRAIWDDLTPRNDHPITSPTEIEVAKQITLDFAKSNTVSITEAEALELLQKARLHPRLIQFSVEQLHNDETDLATILRRLDELKDYTVQEALDELIRRTVAQMAEHGRHGKDAKALLSNLTILKGFFPDAAIQALAPENLKDVDSLLHARETLQKWQFLRRDPITKRFTLGELVTEALGQPNAVDVFKAYASYFTLRAAEIFSMPKEEWKNHEGDLPNILSLGDTLVNLLPRPIPHIDMQNDFEKGLIPTAFFFALFTNEFVATRIEYRRLSWLQMGLAIVEENGDLEAQARFLVAIGRLLDAYGEKRNALGYFEKALTINRIVGNLDGIASGLSNIGVMKTALREHESALACLEEARGLNEAMGDQASLEATLNNLGYFYASLNNIPAALEHFEAALAICRENSDPSSLALTLTNVGFAYSAIGEQSKALTSLNEALLLCQSTGNKRGEAGILNNLAGVWLRLGDKEKALGLFSEALKIIEPLGDAFHVVSALRNIGMLSNDLGNRDAAISFLERAVEIAVRIDHPDLKRCKYSLAQVKRQRDTGVSQQDAFYLQLIEIYRNEGEVELRQYLLIDGAPIEELDKIVQDVKEAAALGSG